MLLLWDCFAVTKPLSQIQKSTLWPLQDANPTPSLGGFGLNPAVDRELREAEERRGRRKAEHEERRLHEELEKRNLELERLVTRLKVPDDKLQQQLARHLDALKRLVEDAGEIVENAQDPRSTGN